jgi:hypothetical protein
MKKFMTIKGEVVWLSTTGSLMGYKVGQRVKRPFSGPGTIVGFNEGTVWVSFDKDNGRVKPVKKGWVLEREEPIYT